MSRIVDELNAIEKEIYEKRKAEEAAMRASFESKWPAMRQYILERCITSQYLNSHITTFSEKMMLEAVGMDVAHFNVNFDRFKARCKDQGLLVEVECDDRIQFSWKGI